MYIAMHCPEFGASSVNSKPVICPQCKLSDWINADLSACDPGQTFTCARCGTLVIVNWGLVEPDHLSLWINGEHCPHHLCQWLTSRNAEKKGFRL